MILSILKISCKGCKTQEMELAASPIGRILGLPAQAAAGQEAQTMRWAPTLSHGFLIISLQAELSRDNR
jgi:hypothetical protein